MSAHYPLKRLTQLTTAPLRTPLEDFVSGHLGRPWRVKEARDLKDLASHPAAILSDGAYPVFAKFSDAPKGGEQFAVELAGLRLLAARAGVLTPTPLGVVPVPGGSILVTEAVAAIVRGPHQWRQIGQTLARLHTVKGSSFGLATPGYFGPLPQANTPTNDWPTFYAEQRLQPGLRLAIATGHLPPTLIQQIEALIARLPTLCGPQVVPALLHGDAQQNNFISTLAGAVVIDPAVYYGHPEMDLALLDYFEPVPDTVFAGYGEVLPIDPGFWQRRELWRIWSHLAVVTVAGPSYLDPLTAAVQKYR